MQYGKCHLYVNIFWCISDMSETMLIINSEFLSSKYWESSSGARHDRRSSNMRLVLIYTLRKAQKKTVAFQKGSHSFHLGKRAARIELALEMKYGIWKLGNQKGKYHQWRQECDQKHWEDKQWCIWRSENSVLLNQVVHWKTKASKGLVS